MGQYEADPACARCERTFQLKDKRHVVADSVTDERSIICDACLIDPERLASQTFFSFAVASDLHHAILAKPATYRMRSADLLETFVASLENGRIVVIENEQRV